MRIHPCCRDTWCSPGGRVRRHARDTWTRGRRETRDDRAAAAPSPAHDTVRQGRVAGWLRPPAAIRSSAQCSARPWPGTAWPASGVACLTIQPQPPGCPLTPTALGSAASPWARPRARPWARPPSRSWKVSRYTTSRESRATPRPAPVVGLRGSQALAVHSKRRETVRCDARQTAWKAVTVSPRGTVWPGTALADDPPPRARRALAVDASVRPGSESH